MGETAEDDDEVLYYRVHLKVFKCIPHRIISGANSLRTVRGTIIYKLFFRLYSSRYFYLYFTVVAFTTITTIFISRTVSLTIVISNLLLSIIMFLFL